ncbi:MAG TPA: transcriptional initiation protein Tat, partial [Myxococcales bacterium]|nr:transcriptional initiation protein Tat [Myxococcales bacterium]
MTKKTERLSRRDFLSRTAAACAGLGALGAAPNPLQSIAWAAGNESSLPKAKDRYFIFCYFAGGWDILLSLDPRDPVKFNAGNLSVTHIEPGYGQLDDPPNAGKPYTVKDAQGQPQILGCYVGDVLKHLDKFSFVRGMSMDTLTHEVGRRRFITGKPPSGLLARGSSGATWLASWLGQQDIIPNLAVRVETYNVDRPNFATGLKVSSV